MSETDSDQSADVQSTSQPASPVVTDDDIEPVVEKLDEIINQGYRARRVFEDWLELTLASLSQNEEQYQSVIDRYDDSSDYYEAPPQLFAEAFGELVVVTDDVGVEVLGNIYEHYRASSDNLGQFFTPHTASAAMAQMSIGPGDTDTDGPTRIADPACGSGRLLIHAANTVDNGEYTGQDKDRICAMMTAVNLWLFDLDGYAIHGDSLTQDHYTVWQTITTPDGTAVREIDPSETADTTSEGASSTAQATLGED